MLLHRYDSISFKLVLRTHLAWKNKKVVFAVSGSGLYAGWGHTYRLNLLKQLLRDLLNAAVSWRRTIPSFYYRAGTILLSLHVLVIKFTTNCNCRLKNRSIEDTIVIRNFIRVPLAWVTIHWPSVFMHRCCSGSRNARILAQKINLSLLEFTGIS